MPHRLHSRAIEQYLAHYTRVNTRVDVSAMARAPLRQMRQDYGALVRALPSGSRVLDVGCGTGLLLQWLSTEPNVEALGVDSSATQVEMLRRALPHADVRCDDGTAFLERHVEDLSGVFCIDVLEHLTDDDDCLGLVEAARGALRPGGFFVCRVPNAANLTGSYSRYMDLTHHRVFTRTSLLQLLDVAGFVGVRVVPTRPVGLGGRLRQCVEGLVHRAVYRLCGRAFESIFTRNVCAVGFKDALGR